MLQTLLLSQTEEIQEPQFEDYISVIETLAKKRRTSSCDTLSMSSRSSLEGQSDPGSTSFTLRLLCM